MVGAVNGLRAEYKEQISAFLANKPGVVADLCAALIERNVNIQAMTVLDTVDVGTMRMVVDNVEVAKEALNAAGAAYTIVPVISVNIPNLRGGFAQIARKIADAGINIEYVYATAMPGTDHTLGIFRVSNQAAALEIDFED